VFNKFITTTKLISVTLILFFLSLMVLL